MLLAVERANGGELAGLEQVLVAFESLFDRQMDADGYAESCALLCEAGLVEYTDECLGLTPVGRKLLRRTGVPGSSVRPRNVTAELELLEECDLAAAGSVSSPSEEAFEMAGADLSADEETGAEPVLGAALAPKPLGNLFPYGMGPAAQAGQAGSGPRVASRFFGRRTATPEGPMVQPIEEEEPAGGD
jgi:hypothetical protein